MTGIKFLLKVSIHKSRTNVMRIKEMIDHQIAVAFNKFSQLHCRTRRKCMDTSEEILYFDTGAYNVERLTLYMKLPVFLLYLPFPEDLNLFPLMQIYNKQ